MKFNDLILLSAILLIAISGQPSSPGQTEAAAAIRCQNGVCERVYKEETFQTETAPTPAPVESLDTLPERVEAAPTVEQPVRSILTKQTTTSKQGLLKRVCKRCFSGKLKNRPGKLLNFRGRR